MVQIVLLHYIKNVTFAKLIQVIKKIAESLYDSKKKKKEIKKSNLTVILEIVCYIIKK